MGSLRMVTHGTVEILAFPAASLVESVCSIKGFAKDTNHPKMEDLAMFVRTLTAAQASTLVKDAVFRYILEPG
eukprot:12823212-Alexandrium_andersonii.AAC.1